MKKLNELPIAKIASIASILKTLGHPVRIKIICILENKKLSVNEILGLINNNNNNNNIDQPTLSHHLIKLKNAKILKSSKSGLHVYYELTSKKYSELLHCME